MKVTKFTEKSILLSYDFTSTEKLVLLLSL